MPLKLFPTPEPKISDQEIKDAISIRAAECFGAMSVCNALGGTPDTKWQLIHSNSFQEILAEADARGIGCDSLLCAVSKTPVPWSAYYLEARGVITEAQMRQRFQREIKRGAGDWQDPTPQPVAA